MKKILNLFAAAILLSSCSSTPTYYRPSQGDLANVKRLAVTIDGAVKFKVLDHRATELGPGILFGAVGVVANSVYTNSKDSDLQKQLEKQATQVSCLEFFKEEFKKLLEESKKFEKIDFYDQRDAKKEPADAVLELSIEEWGIRLIDQRAENLVPYVVVEIRLTDRNGKILWKERDSEVGHSSYVFGKYLGQENFLKDEIQKVLKDTTYRIVSTLRYS